VSTVSTWSRALFLAFLLVILYLPHALQYFIHCTLVSLMLRIPRSLSPLVHCDCHGFETRINQASLTLGKLDFNCCLWSHALAVITSLDRFRDNCITIHHNRLASSLLTSCPISRSSHEVLCFLIIQMPIVSIRCLCTYACVFCELSR